MRMGAAEARKSRFSETVADRPRARSGGRENSENHCTICLNTFLQSWKHKKQSKFVIFDRFCPPFGIRPPSFRPARSFSGQVASFRGAILNNRQILTKN